MGNESTDIPDKQDIQSTSMFVKLKEKDYRNKFLYWLRLPFGFFTLGIVDALGSAANLDLQIITNTDKEMASFFFTAYNGGYFIGSVLCGFLYGKVNSNLSMAILTLLCGAATIATPFCSSLVVMIIIRLVIGTFLGIIVCMLIADHMDMWCTEGHSLHQFNNCIYAVGGVLGPLITSPFVAEKEAEESTRLNTTLHSHFNYDAMNSTAMFQSEETSYFNATLVLSVNETDPKNSTSLQATDVRYAFFIGGSILALTAIQFLAAFLLSRKQVDLLTQKTNEEYQTRNLPRHIYVLLAALLFVYYLTYACVEVTFNMYIMTFLVEQYNEISKHQGEYIYTYFWTAFAVARFFSVFTSRYLTSVRIMYLHLTFIVLAFIGFLVSALYSRIEALTAFTCLMGVACSPMFAAGTTWTEDEIMKVTGLISSVILTAASIGPMVLPFVVGHLMMHSTNFWFCYIVMISIGLSIASFIILLTFNRFYVNKKYGKLCQDKQKHESNGVHIEHVEPAS